MKVPVEISTEVVHTNRKILGRDYPYVLLYNQHIFGSDTLLGLVWEVLRHRRVG